MEEKRLKFLGKVAEYLIVRLYDFKPKMTQPLSVFPLVMYLFDKDFKQEKLETSFYVERGSVDNFILYYLPVIHKELERMVLLNPDDMYIYATKPALFMVRLFYAASSILLAAITEKPVDKNNLSALLKKLAEIQSGEITDPLLLQQLENNVKK